MRQKRTIRASSVSAKRGVWLGWAIFCSFARGDYDGPFLPRSQSTQHTSRVGTSLGSEACWMLRATSSSCSTRSRSSISCSRRCPSSSEEPVPVPHSSEILPSDMRWMKMAMEAISLLPAGGRAVQKLPSIVGAPPADAAYHLLACGYLVLYDEANVGEGADRVGNLELVAFAVGLLAGKPVRVAEEVGS